MGKFYLGIFDSILWAPQNGVALGFYITFDKTRAKEATLNGNMVRLFHLSKNNKPTAVINITR